MNAGTNDKNYSNTEIHYLKDKMQQFVDERDWQQFLSPKNLTMSIAIEAAELMEIFQWQTVPESMQAIKDTDTLEKLKEELADVMIYCLNLANRLG
ncbi:MAG: nucleotide pyrophosphohydrolase [Candidatus Hodarchaeales archaeon]|jgi:NTP pyrophosphatase (non-canonical NTP hydrolase)